MHHEVSGLNREKRERRKEKPKKRAQFLPPTGLIPLILTGIASKGTPTNNNQ
jgi:hypothetical protein